MKLKIHKRGAQEDSNQFVKVHPSTIRRLFSEASSKHNTEIFEHNGWNLHDEQGDNVQFLPMRIGFRVGSETQYLYCSYNGGTCDAEDTIDMPLSFYEGVEIGTENTIVGVHALSSIQNASSIQIEPVSTSNWELMEVYAQELEDGIVLSQISVVYPGQIFSLALGTDTVHVRVLDDGFTADKSFDQSVDMCLRLVSDTEVVVKPKSRKIDADDQASFPPSSPIKILPAEADFSTDMKKLHRICNEGSLLIPSPPPFTAWMNPTSLKDVPGWDAASFSEPDTSFSPCSAHVLVRKTHGNGTSCSGNGDVALVELVSSEIVSANGIVLHSDITLQIGASPLYDLVSVTVLSSKDVQQRIESLSNADDVTKRFSPVFFSPTSGDRSPWRHPEECKASSSVEQIRSPISIAPAGRQLPTADLYDTNGSTLLVHGSIISIPTNNNTVATYRLQLERSGSGKRKKRLLSSRLKREDDFSRYVLRARDISNAAFDDSASEISIPIHDTMLNALSSSTPPTKEYISFLQKIEDELVNQTLDSRSDDSSFWNLMLCGEKGIGKTYFIVTLAARLRMKLSYSTVFLNCHRLQSAQTKMEHLLNELTRVFTQASKLQPSLLLLDSLDLLIPNTGSSPGMSDDSANRHQNNNPMLVSQCKILADHLKFLMSGLRSSKVAVICTCLDENKLHKSLRTVDTFTSKLNVPCLNEIDRFNLFLHSLRQHGSCLPCEELDCKRFSKQTESFLPRDLKVVAAKVALKHQIDSLKSLKKALAMDDIEMIISRYTPLAQQSLHLRRSEAPIKFTDIGGLFEAKQSLSSIILKPIKYNCIYKHTPISLPRGLLLYGFPGCGKSCIVPAIAQECGFNLVTCRGPELLDKFIGASEAKVRNLFERAYAAAPSILFLDEFDALAPRRGSDNTGVTDRVVNQLLTFLDGVEDHGGRDDGTVYIIAASSRPDKIDPALVRPGRLEKHVFIGYPQSDIEFDDLLCNISKTREMDEELNIMIVGGSFRDQLSIRQCQYLNLSPADIQGVFDTAHLSAVHDLLRTKEQKMTVDANLSIAIKCNHLLEAFESTRPSLSTADRRMFSRTFAPFLGIDKQHISADKRKLKTALK